MHITKGIRKINSFFPPSSVHLFINDVRVDIEAREDPRHLGESHWVAKLDVQQVRYNAIVWSNLVELRFRIHSTAMHLHPRNTMVIAVFPCGLQHYLGPLLCSKPVPSARLHTEVPEEVRIVFCVDSCISPEEEAPWPCEMLLKHHIKIILENDEFCGSVESSHLQNIMKELPFYASALTRLRWSNFVKHFGIKYGAWKVICNGTICDSEQQLAKQSAPGYVHLVANKYARSYVRGDVDREKVKQKALSEFYCLLLCNSPSRVSRQALCQLQVPQEVVRQLSTSQCFRTLNSVNYRHVLNQLANTHLVLCSDAHPILVGMQKTSGYSNICDDLGTSSEGSLTTTCS